MDHGASESQYHADEKNPDYAALMAAILAHSFLIPTSRDADTSQGQGLCPLAAGP
jgi:hypothetical protein